MTQELLVSLQIVCKNLDIAVKHDQAYDDSLCSVIEDILLDGLHCEPDDLWGLLKSVSHHSQNEFIEKLDNLSSHAGFVRAWIRLSLNDGAMCSALTLLSQEENLTHYYKDDAFIINRGNVDAALLYLQSLDKQHELNFACNTTVLNHWRNDGEWNTSNCCTGECDDEVFNSESPYFNRRFSHGNKLSCEDDGMPELDECLTSLSSSEMPINYPSISGGPQYSSSPLHSHPDSSGLVCWTNSQSDIILPPNSRQPSTETDLRYHSTDETPSISGSTSHISSTPPPRLHARRHSTSLDRRVRCHQSTPRYAHHNRAHSVDIFLPDTTMDTTKSSVSDISSLPEEDSDMLTPFVDTEERLTYFTMLCSEQGLTSQESKCYACPSVIGNHDYRVCEYDKHYYCRTCYGSFTNIVPSRLIYNWDHNKYRVSKKSFDFLTRVYSLPNVDLSKLNESLYHHVEELAMIRDYRIKLNMCREYLVRCNSNDETTYDSIRKKLGAHQYYWDSPHLYSLSDLCRTPSGQLQNRLKKLVQKSTHHVYRCKKCSSLGFICEYCQDPTIIFPFELETTDQCSKCNAVFHKRCKHNATCPKCVRREKLAAKNKTVLITDDFST